MITDCERFDLYREKWNRLPHLNHARGNPGTLLTNDKKYLYAFQGFYNQFQAPQANVFNAAFAVPQ